jgi:hypothetical protein
MNWYKLFILIVIIFIALYINININMKKSLITGGNDFSRNFNKFEENEIIQSDTFPEIKLYFPITSKKKTIGT